MYKTEENIRPVHKNGTMDYMDWGKEHKGAKSVTQFNMKI